MIANSGSPPQPPDETSLRDGSACPHCGHVPTPYEAKLSALLDMVLLLDAVVHDLKHQVEELAS